MESVASNSPPSPPPPHSLSLTLVGERILRAFGHPLRLLHRSGADFFVLGSTGNVYQVTLTAAPSCSCPDRVVPCKHILFVLLRALGVPLDAPCLWRPSILPDELSRLLATPTAEAAGVLAGAHARERFQQLLGGERSAGADERAEVEEEEEEGAVCPVCLDEIGRGDNQGLVRCGRCGNALHEECWTRWRRSRGRRMAICVICRAQWRRWRRREQDAYINLSAYMTDDEYMAAEDASCTG